MRVQGVLAALATLALPVAYPGRHALEVRVRGRDGTYLAATSFGPGVVMIDGDRPTPVALTVRGPFR